MSDGTNYTVVIHNEGDGMLWAEVPQLPGCFASGADMAELTEAVAEAITLYVGPQQLIVLGEDANDAVAGEHRGDLHPSQMVLTSCGSAGHD